MSSVLFAFVILAGLGIVLGIGLAIADKKLKIEKDEKLIKLENMMPGANCGGCGFAGCQAYAEAVFKGNAKPGLCAPGGKTLAAGMSEVMGLQQQENGEEKAVEYKAYVFCNESCGAKKKDFDYKGLCDCNAASMLFKGDNSCKDGCLGFGSCIKACQFGAVSKNDDGIIEVDRNKCTGCGQCTKVCPNGVIKLIPSTQKFAVKCNSHDKGIDVRKNCSKGCIGCKICETKFPEYGFKVDNFLSVAPSETNLSDKNAEEIFLEACPRKIIVRI
ncbi:MAG: RnfABCDGE type electron transport complex subunit B [Sphaerochaetaceae bacterium]|nr:RnfABCDGE type electron transport complex subunit B [Sphaerochaetaceae bacterium]